jgi:hypothetical protein
MHQLDAMHPTAILLTTLLVVLSTRVTHYFLPHESHDMSLDRWDESADSFDDCEYPEEADGDDGSADTIGCPHCGADVYEDADQCPECGMYLVADTRVWSGKSLWWIALGLLGIVAVILALVLGL